MGKRIDMTEYQLIVISNQSFQERMIQTSMIRSWKRHMTRTKSVEPDLEELAGKYL